MVRKYCPELVKKRSDRPKRYPSYYERNPVNCLSKKCCDSERLWCIEADCSIFECNKNTWRNRSRKIEERVDGIPAVGERLKNIIERVENEEIDLTDKEDSRSFKILRDFFRAMRNWHPGESGDDEIDLFYRYKFGDDNE